MFLIVVYLFEVMSLPYVVSEVCFPFFFFFLSTTVSKWG